MFFLIFPVLVNFLADVDSALVSEYKIIAT